MSRSQAKHLYTLGVCKICGFSHLERRAGRREKHQLIQPAFALRRRGNSQMPAMHRVKGAAEQTRLHLQTAGILIGQEAADGKLDKLLLHGQTAVMLDEFAQIAVIGGIFGNALVATIHQHVEVQFGMQMCGEHAVICADGAHLSTTPDQLAQTHINAVQVRVQRLTAKHLAALRLAECMAHNHHLAPAATGICRIGNQPHTNGINGVSQVRITATLAIPVLAQMARGSQAQAAGLIVPLPIRLTYRKIKTICQRHKRPLAIRRLLRHDDSIRLRTKACNKQGSQQKQITKQTQHGMHAITQGACWQAPKTACCHYSYTHFLLVCPGQYGTIAAMKLHHTPLMVLLACALVLPGCRPPSQGHASPEAAEELAQITAILPEVGVEEVLELPAADDIFTLVAAFGVTPDARQTAANSGITMLHLACLFKKPELARCLLLDHADPNARSVTGDTPLSLAVAIRGIEDESVTDDAIIALLDILLAGGADIHATAPNEMSLLNYAGLSSFSEKVFLYLLDKGCKPDAVTCQAPAMMGWNTALQRVLNMGTAKSPEEMDALLLMAAANLHKDTVELLLNAGADVNAQRMGGTTPLLEAAGHLLSPAEEEECERKAAILDICALLIQRGADPQLAEIRQDGSPAFSATDILTRDAETMEELRKRGVDLTPQEITYTSGIALLEAIGKATVLERIPPASAFDAIAAALTPTDEMRSYQGYHDILPMAVELLHGMDAARASQHVAGMPLWTGAEAWEKGHGDCVLPAISKCENIVLPKQIICATAEHLANAGKVDSAASVIELLSRCPDAEAEINQYCQHESIALRAGALGAKLRRAGLPTPRDGDVQLWLENHNRTADTPLLQKAVLLTSLSRLWYGDMLPGEQEQMLLAMEEIGATTAAGRYRAIVAAMDKPDELDKLTEDSDSWKFELEITTAQFILNNAAEFRTPAP